jgi:hypothetical protein
VYVRAIRDQPALQERYRMKLAEVVAKVPLATVQAKADAIYDQIKDAAHADTVKTFPNDTFDWNRENIKSFAAARYAAIQSQLGI